MPTTPNLNEMAAAVMDCDGLDFFSTTPCPLWKKDKNSELIYDDGACV